MFLNLDTVKSFDLKILYTYLSRSGFDIAKQFIDFIKVRVEKEEPEEEG